MGGKQTGKITCQRKEKKGKINKNKLLRNSDGSNPRRGGHPDNYKGYTSKLSLYQPSRLIRGTPH